MDKEQIFLTTAILCFLGILFMPTDSSAWFILFLAGFGMGILWFRARR